MAAVTSEMIAQAIANERVKLEVEHRRRQVHRAYEEAHWKVQNSAKYLLIKTFIVCVGVFGVLPSWIYYAYLFDPVFTKLDLSFGACFFLTSAASIATFWSFLRFCRKILEAEKADVRNYADRLMRPNSAENNRCPRCHTVFTTSVKDFCPTCGVSL